MSSEELPPLEELPVCPVDCPNRRTDGRRSGITLRFGKRHSIHSDPLEVLLIIILAMPVGITLRDAWTISFRESIERVVMMVVALGAVHKAPTGKLYELLASKEV